jgi:purine-binding chemotaxis protein CheW
MANETQMVGFRVGAETFAVPIALVHEIVRLPRITAVPEAPSYVEGVMNLRGKIVPVVDLRKRFGEPTPVADKRNRVIVAELDGRRFGLIVDSASEVLKIAPAQVEAPPAVFGEGEVRYVTGVAKLGARIVILVDLTKVLQNGELKRIGELAQAETPATT